MVWYGLTNQCREGEKELGKLLATDTRTTQDWYLPLRVVLLNRFDFLRLMYPLSMKVFRTDIPQMTYVHCLLSALETCFSTNERMAECFRISYKVSLMNKRC